MVNSSAGGRAARLSGAACAGFAALLSLSALAACNKDKGAVQDTATVPAAASPAPATPAPGAGLSVVDLDMGRHIGPDKKISDKTDDFAPTDTIYGSLHTTGDAASSTIMTRWTFENGSTVAENSQTVTTAGTDGYTEFHISKQGGLPKGKYTMHVFIDGKEVRTKDVTVK